MGMGAVKVNENTIENLTKDVLEKAKRLGLTHEVHDLIGRVEDIHEILSKKSAELNTLEALAWESDDENIAELRNQLLTATKLVYSDLVTEAVAKRDAFSPGFNMWDDDEDNDVDFTPKKSLSISNVFAKIRNRIVDYKKVKDIVKEVKIKA